MKNKKLNTIRELSPNVINAYGDGGTINDALSDTLEQFIIKTKLSYQDAVSQRRIIGLQIRHES